MCRYAMYGPYKRHMACFDCRKGFKRAPLGDWNCPADDPAPCPDCGRPMASMGLDFRPPPRRAVEHWAVVEHLFSFGFAYHSCGCSGPGYRPHRWEDVPAFLAAGREQSAGEELLARFAAK